MNRITSALVTKLSQNFRVQLVPSDCSSDLREQLKCADVLVTSRTIWSLLQNYVQADQVFGGRLVIVPPNPTTKFIDSLVADSERRSEIIMAVGGGSVIDVAKILRLLESSQKSISANYSSWISQISMHPKLIDFDSQARILFWPSTTGTGAEVTDFATLWGIDTLTKHSVLCISSDIDVIYYWPRLFKTIPRQVKLSSIFDALGHCYDVIWNRWADNSDVQSAKQIAEIIFDVALNYDGMDNDESVWCLFLCGGLAGTLIKKTKTSLCHAGSYYLTLNYNVPHGFAVGLSLSSVAKWCIDSGCGNADGWLAKNFPVLLELESHTKLFSSCRKYFPNNYSEINFVQYQKQVVQELRYQNFLCALERPTLEKILQEAVSKVYFQIHA